MKIKTSKQLKKLKEQGIPQATDDHIMLKGKDDKSKNHVENKWKRS